MNFNVGSLRTDTYRIALSIYNPVIDTTIILPVTLDFIEAVTPPNPGMTTPTEHTAAPELSEPLQSDNHN